MKELISFLIFILDSLGTESVAYLFLLCWIVISGLSVTCYRLIHKISSDISNINDNINNLNKVNDELLQIKELLIKLDEKGLFIQDEIRESLATYLNNINSSIEIINNNIEHLYSIIPNINISGNQTCINSKQELTNELERILHKIKQDKL